MSKSIDEIKQELEKAYQEYLITEGQSTKLDNACTSLVGDARIGVMKLTAKYRKAQSLFHEEQKRTGIMYIYEHKYGDTHVVCGIDEVGRGPLAGPVVAGAVVLPRDHEILYLNDSKQLTPLRREKLAKTIKEEAITYGIGVIGPARIDEINILQATYEAMQQAISKLDPMPDLFLNDAVKIPKLTSQQIPLIKGDTLSASIAAASIIAKVTRDEMMVEYDKIIPGYGFAQNKGYGSEEHIEAIRRMGPSPIHRRSFIGHFTTEY